MSSIRRPPKDPCWLIWQKDHDGLFLRAVTTDEELADGFLKVLRLEEEEFYSKRNFYKETSQLNHLYGVSAIQKFKHLRRKT